MDPRHRLGQLALSENGFVFDPMTGSTFTANAAGLEILRGLASARSREEIVAALERRFDTGDADLERDVLEFLHLLHQSGLVPAELRL